MRQQHNPDLDAALPWPEWASYRVDVRVDDEWRLLAYAETLIGMDSTAVSVGGDCRAVRRDGSTAWECRDGKVGCGVTRDKGARI